jgi:DNA-binding HxlR family transcriptional regulator
MKTRPYNHYCGLASALDIIGEHWAILIVRELSAGPRRFKDLKEGLPGISTNVLSDRLRNLEQRGVVIRHMLPPPAGSIVYELTDLGRALEPTLIELGKWGSQFLPKTPDGAIVLHAGSYALMLKTFFRPELAQQLNETYELHIDGEVLQVQIAAGQLRVQQGQASPADAIFQTDIATFLALLRRQIQPEDAVAGGRVQVGGDPAALGRFLEICGLPEA